jgi:cytoskeleton protein RodZ
LSRGVGFVGQAGIAYDLASRKRKIPFAVLRKRETGLPSFGEKLKQEREKRKITLEQISASTKIGTRMLQALEEDKFNQLPGGIFNKGFVRAYSRAVGLDEDQAVAEYLEASGDAPPPRTEIGAREEGERNNNNRNDNEERVREENLRRMEASADDSRRSLPWGLFAAILLVIALALSLWSRHQREHNRQSLRASVSTTSQSLPVASPKPASSTIANSANSNAAVANSTKPNSTSSDSTISNSTISNSTSFTSTNTGLRTGSAATPSPSGNSADSPAPGAGEFTVVIQAREDSWVSITADGKPALSELLTAGSERSFHGRKEIVVKAGNAGALDFRLNGRKLEPGGDYGEVKTVTFGPDGILANTSPPPSTP